MGHKEGCTFEDISIDLYLHNRNGPDERFYLEEHEMLHETNVHQPGPNTSTFIAFNFCPVCGVNYYE